MMVQVHFQILRFMSKRELSGSAGPDYLKSLLGGKVDTLDLKSNSIKGVPVQIW